jgi:GT2 family glycosyltransferase
MKVDAHMTQGDIVGLVLHFRTPQRTLSCLDSLRREGIAEVVIVDNSQDGGDSVIAMTSGIKALSERGMRATVLPQERNLGFAAGVNAGIRHIIGEYASDVLLINSDATLGSGALAAMKHLLPDAALVAPYACAVDGGQLQSPLVFYQKYLALYLRQPVPGSITYPSGSCLLVRRDYVNTDIFDDEFFFYGEDVTLGYRIAEGGGVFRDCPNATVVHAGSVSSKNGSKFYEYHMNRAHWLLAGKLARNHLEHFLCVLTRCITLPLRALVRSLRWRSLTPLIALGWATSDVLRGRCRDLTPPAVR